MIKLGLTGSIGMGKSSTAAMFAARGVPVYDADAAVHAAYAPGGAAVAAVEKAFGGVTGPDGGIDRAALRRRVVGNSAEMKRLEAIVHPIVGGMERAFLETARKSGADIVVLDIPLLFENGGEGRADAIAVVSAPAAVQRARVLGRGTMTETEFEAILARQTPDAKKRKRADFVINTGLGFRYAEAQVDAILAAIRGDGSRAECAKSSSIPRPRASSPRRTASSRSAALS